MIWPTSSDIVRLLIVTPLGYAALIIILRISGKRMLSKMSAFDLVVTVALGSTLATILLSKQVALVEGVLAVALLIGLQYIVAWSAARSRLVRCIIKSEPALLFFRGHFLTQTLREENVSEEAVRSAMRAQSIGSLEDVEAVVLEADGSFSTIRRSETNGTSTLTDVRNFPPGPTT